MTGIAKAIILPIHATDTRVSLRNTPVRALVPCTDSSRER